LELLLLSIEFHLLERNDELSQFLSLGKGQQSHAVWLGYNLFHDQKLLHCDGNVTSSVYMERYRNVAQYLENYRPNGIAINFQIYTINTAIHSLWYRHKQVQIAQQQAPFDFCFANTNLDFKLPPCFECCIISFGQFPGFCVLNADVSEHSDCFIFTGE
jgi:hypothetical protein